jgi:predicted NAD/FAD-binding protein
VKIAVIGSGIAGTGAAWALARHHEITLLEADDRLGGHANTVEVEDRGSTVPVDTGFIVYNEANYPHLTRLFAATGVPTESSDMSFSVSLGGGTFEYQARALGLLAQPSNALDPRYLGMVRDILRFTREARGLIGTGSRATTAEWLEAEDYGEAFVEDFLLPMVGCIWSSSLRDMLDYPAETMVRFLDNHGLLRVLKRPRWRTVTGGSRAYVQRVTAGLDDVRVGTPVASVHRDADGVVVVLGDGTAERFDHAVMATHADTSLSILGAETTPAERSILGAFRFQENLAVLHRDPGLMPRRRRAWSSWNYLAEGRSERDRDGRVSLSYWMNRLQNLETEQPVIVTLNPAREPAGALASFTYHHPIYDRAAVDAQAALPSIQGRHRTWFAGAWTAFGFHEDGLRSGLRVAAALGAEVPWAGQVPVAPADADHDQIVPLPGGDDLTAPIPDEVVA